MTYSEFYNTNKGKYYTLNDWKNKHGERFKIIQLRQSTKIWITGDEYDWEMTPLFNPGFDTYSQSELNEIARALYEE